MTPETPAQTITRLKKQIANLSAGRQLMCGFCGEVYGSQGRTELLASVKKHVAKCPDHPIHQLREALEESVKLQSHYAGLLNMHDGGQRIQFANADAWIARLQALNPKAEQGPVAKPARKKR